MKFIKYSSFCVAALLLSSGCTKNFEDINTNPASYNQANFNPNYILTNAQLGYTGSSDFAYDTWRANLIYASTMMQGFSSVMGYWAGDKYALNPDYTAAYWMNDNGAVGAYPEQVKFVVDLVQSTAGKPQYNNIHQVGRIMKALIMERITDLYGDVPYFDAGMGYYNGNFTPKYDAQSLIYADMLKEVEEAVAALNVDGGDKITGDAIYNGDINKWKRFGNTLILRMAMRLVKVDENLAKSYVQKVVDKTMLNNLDNAFLKGDVAGARTTQNRNSQILLGDGGPESYYVKWSDTFINKLKASSDPRLSKVAVTQIYLSEGDKNQNSSYKTDPSAQKGMPNGKDLSGIAGRDIRQDASFTDFADYSSPNPAMIKRDGNTFILTYAESELLLAEAAQRWGIGGTASEHYNKGVKAAMTFLTQYDASIAISEATADAYLASNPYVAANGLEQINTQYWIHTNTMLDFYESWSNWRRSGFPVLTPVVHPTGVTSGAIPRRFPYPAYEETTNAANYRAASAAVPGGDKLTGKVWWDK
ncbi:SusD/RagB family nutrient-binding outer membrane lipoprotein [Solitalea sp. MAHUQ-68]|uniref:SusD/RagB family nutrient-binding outer membrane lipoprotein n=2 Tax=Sphingobacteriaceae TaxID=84566 RepID=A0A9X2EYK4_9SPHI|nr:SusD/RagB family nutrient-binding outer membrane lipoprotein [Solitalea agri]